MKSRTLGYVVQQPIIKTSVRSISMPISALLKLPDMQIQWIQVAVFVFLFLTGLFVTQGAPPGTITGWMKVFGPEDEALQTFAGTIQFFKDLRLPINPFIVLLEVQEYRLTGSNDFSTGILFRSVYAFVFAIAPVMFNKAGWRLIASTVASFVFLVGSAGAFTGAPTPTYDVYFPLFIFAFIFLIDRAKKQDVYAGWWCAGAGFVLSFAELTRPFVFALVPLMVAFACISLKNKKSFAFFLLPLLLFSGGWHVKLYVFNDKQILTSNHGGFNILNVWYAPGARRLKMVPEPDTPLKRFPVRWKNLNSYEHTINSQRMMALVVKDVKQNLGILPAFGRERIRFFLSGQTRFYNHDPNEPEWWFYWLYTQLMNLSRLWILWVFVGLIGLGFLKWADFGNTENMLIVVTMATVFLLACFEATEESRLVITVLPLLAALPIVRLKPNF